MKTQITAINAEAEQLLPPNQPDGSRIGVNYIDAYLKPMNVSLEDGTKVTCKRKGLKILLTIGDKQGEAILRRIEHGPDEQAILQQALEAAATDAGSTYTVEDGKIFLEV